MTRNQDLAMSILYKIGKSEKVSMHISIYDWLTVYLWEENKISKIIGIPPYLSDVEAVKLYDEVVDFMSENEVVENLDFQQEMQDEMLTAAERDSKAIEEVF